MTVTDAALPRLIEGMVGMRREGRGPWSRKLLLELAFLALAALALLLGLPPAATPTAAPPAALPAPAGTQAALPTPAAGPAAAALRTGSPGR